MPISFTSDPVKVVDKILESISKHMEDKVIGNSQDGFMKGKSCLIKHKAFHNEATTLVDEGTPEDVVHVDFSKVFDSLP